MGIESVAAGGSRGFASAREGLGAVVEGVGKGAVVLGALCRGGIALIRLAQAHRSRWSDTAELVARDFWLAPSRL